MSTEAMKEPTGSASATETLVYNDSISRWFVGASVVWGIVGMLVGVIIALQMAWWQANISPYLTFGRLRPLHTNAVIFAFVGNMIFAGDLLLHAAAREGAARRSDAAGKDPLLAAGRLIIVAAAITLPLGLTQGKEYAELEWPIDLAIAVIWVIFAINFFWTLARRREKHLYVAIWFYIATIAHDRGSAYRQQPRDPGLPVQELLASIGGAKDALVQWWYGHNAVAFFLTTPVLGIMYYFLPKAANRPGLFVPALHHPLLGAHLPLHLGRPAPPAEHRAPGLGADARAWSSA